jgi:hypothetical protein
MTIFSGQARKLQRRRRTSLSLAAGVAAAAWFATLAGATAAHADVAVLPDLPSVSSGEQTGALGLPPLWEGVSYSGSITYTDLLGDTVGSTSNPEPAVFDTYSWAPSTIFSTSPIADEFLDTSSDVANLANGEVGGSDFDYVTMSGWDNYYELTPFAANGANSWTDNINDTLAYAPNGGGELSSIDFGIQYLDLPDAATPVDQINLLGSGGEILLSIPVVGDLFGSL